jgi:hypothetical protein
MSEDGHEVNSDLQKRFPCFIFLFFCCAVFNWPQE